MQGAPTLPALNHAEKRLIAHWGSVAGLFGMSRTSVMITCLLSFRDEPLTVDEISQLLHISRSALLPCLREAEQLGALRATVRPNSREYQYVLTIKHFGLGWLEWRVKRQLAILIDPVILILEDALQNRHNFSPTVASRLEENLDTFRKQREILFNYTLLDTARQDQLLDHALEMSRRLINTALDK